MSKVPSNSPQRQGKTLAAVSEQSSPNKPSRPGWLEIIVGLVVYAIVGFFGVSQFKRLGLDPAVYGLILTSWTGADSFPKYFRCAPHFCSLAPDRCWSRSGCLRAQGFGDPGLDQGHRGHEQCPGCLCRWRSRWVTISGFKHGVPRGLFTLRRGTALSRHCHQRAIALRPICWGRGQHCDLRPHARDQLHLPRSRSSRSCHRRDLPPQWIDLAGSRRPRRFQPALVSARSAYQHRLTWHLLKSIRSCKLSQLESS
jgi:hypothetical protein